MISLEGALELAVARGGSAAGLGASADVQAIDPRHRYLRLVLVDPGSKDAIELGERLGRVAPHDRIVAAATGVARLASVTAAEPEAAAKLLAHDPGDPLLVAVALRLANKLGDVVTAEKARTTLALLAGRLDLVPPALREIQPALTNAAPIASAREWFGVSPRARTRTALTTSAVAT